MNSQLTTEKLRLLFRTSNTLLLGLLAILVVWLGARRVLDGAFSVGLLIAFLGYKDQFLQRVSQLVDKAVDLTMLKLHAERLADIALTSPEPRAADGAPSGQGAGCPFSIELKNVSYRYGPGEPWILSSVSARFEVGEAVAICGPSGGGKSTLLKILAGLLEPTEGTVLINGEPLGRIGLAAYRSRIGVVLQDDHLFAGSIADNISFFTERPDQNLIEASARLASVHDDIIAMPMGYRSLIGDMGMVLSGGQKQRILLARALYRQPSILLLDEATSHLDVDRERLVNQSLRKLTMTQIVIAHRPETIQAADRTLTIVAGKIQTGACASTKRVAELPLAGVSVDQ